MKGLSWLDVLDVLHGQENDAYFNLDSHWKARGNELAAQAAGLHSEWAARYR